MDPDCLGHADDAALLAEALQPAPVVASCSTPSQRGATPRSGRVRIQTGTTQTYLVDKSSPPSLSVTAALSMPSACKLQDRTCT
eukprot:scaffold20899_cov17-Tisochrysis_lutea.AAC.1